MKILVVDDNKSVLDSLSTVLFNHGYSVSTARHGLDASEKLHNDFFDLVIVDHLMPIMNGIQLTKHIRQHDVLADIPVIFMTTQGYKAVELVCNTDIFTAIIEKPIAEHILLKLLNDLLSPNTLYQLL